MTRLATDKPKVAGHQRTPEPFPPLDEKMSIEDAKGSIEVGKDADFLVFDRDLLTAEHEGFSQNKPSEVYFCGKKAN